MTLEVDVQVACDDDDLPGRADLRAWASAAVGALREDAELTIRIVDEAESMRLNSRYRNKDGATNVLSFPFDAPAGVDLPLLGDIVVCAPVVRREAKQQSKSVSSHWAHMVVHGSLHLLGFDHEQARDADEMEAMETRILAALGFDNPYESRGLS
ncbi:MAG: rRNA maturation RNase YbeY [Gammaproteobacteria bacterium]|nr:MAG: rRNA maturation RNase YbeY [Gammaproteobacteria bacterium]